jgi:hypothetical protein
VINYPHQQGSGSLYNKIDDMLNWITANGPTYGGLLAITEFNITHTNQTPNNGIQDESCNSFIAGQYWAECMAVGRRFDFGWFSKFAGIWGWSVQEGSHQAAGDLGMFDYDGFASPQKRSTYHHLAMMAKEFSRGRVELWQNPSNNVKAFGVRDCNGGAVMIMNQNTAGSGSLSYYFSLDNQTPVNMAVDGNISMNWTDKFVTSDGLLLTNALGDIDPMETHLLVLNACGEVIYTYEYNEDHALPPTPYDKPDENSWTGTGCGCVDVRPGYEWYELDPETNPHRVAFLEPTSLSELSETTKLKVYPNPANNEIIIQYAGNFGSPLSIYNAIGVKVYEDNLKVNSTQHHVNIESLPSGVYYCEVNSNDEIKKSTKFIIIH